MSDITTKEKVKAYLSLTGTTNDALIDELIKNVSDTIHGFCNRSLERNTYTEYFDTELGHSKLFLNNYPVISLTSVQYRNGSWGAITWQDLNINDYLLNDNGKVSLSFTTPQAEKYIKIVYVGGYLIDFSNETNATLHTLPYELTQIATEWVSSLFNTRTSTGVSSEKTEGQSISYTPKDTADKTYQNRLASFRRINI